MYKPSDIVLQENYKMEYQTNCLITRLPMTKLHQCDHILKVGETFQAVVPHLIHSNIHHFEI